METRVSDIANYCSTWSGYQEFVKKNGESEGLKLIEKFKQRCDICTKLHLNILIPSLIVMIVFF